MLKAQARQEAEQQHGLVAGALLGLNSALSHCQARMHLADKSLVIKYFTSMLSRLKWLA